VQAMMSVGGDVYSRTDSPVEELFFGSVDGLFLLRQRAGGWQAERQGLEGLHISSLAFDRHSGATFAGTHNGGLQASGDGGKTWERLGGGIEQDEVYSVTVVEAGGQVRVYAGTEPAHLYVSVDAGKTWTDLPGISRVSGTDEWTFPAPPHIAHVKHISADPHSADTIYACVEQGALLKSTDAGQSFRIIYDAPAADAHRFTITPSRPDWLYLTRGDWSRGFEGIYLSKDGGDHWDRLFDRSLGVGYPDATLIHPDHPDLILVAGGGTSPNQWPRDGYVATQIARSRDGGQSWSLLPGLPATKGNIEALAMNVWPGGCGIFAGSSDGEVFHSDDEGDSWSTLAQGLPAISKAGHYRWRERTRAA
jgi:photosystem II stability/assembly factor-like uncharacterized protein